MPCESCKQSYLDSYEVTVATTRQMHPSLSDHELRVAAALAFRPKYVSYRQAAQIENSGNETYENGEFTMIDGRMYFPAINEYAETLHEHQLISSRLHNDPTRYSKDDHERTLLVERSLASGATVVKTVFDGVNGAHRDMVEYVYDHETNRGKIVVHDLSKQNGLLNESRMKQVVIQESQGLQAVIQSEKVFVLTNAPSSLSQRVETVVRAPDPIGFVNERTARKIHLYEPQAAQRREETVPADLVIKNTQETIRYVRQRVIDDLK